MAESSMIIGAHGSGLARSQAETLARDLAQPGVDFEVRLEVVEGAREDQAGLHDDHVAQHRGEIAQLHSMLRNEEIDVVIHRGFDLRGEIPSDLRIGAVLARQNPYDVLVAPTELWLDELDETHKVGVVQLRARAQLLDYRPELEWNLITGDAADWLQSMYKGQIDALIAPGAAIEQLGLQDQVCEIFPPELLVPAPGSGILVCLVRGKDETNQARLKPLHDQDALVEYAAEVALVESLGGVWEQPIGALARLEGEMLHMSAVVATADGSNILRDQYVAAADDAHDAGEEFATLLLHAGAEQILQTGTVEDQGGTSATLQRRGSPDAAPEDEFVDFEEFAQRGEDNGDSESDSPADGPETW